MKKVALLIFTVLCTVGLVAGVASFTLGRNTASYYTDEGNNLSDIYTSFSDQVTHIIDNSNSTDDSVDKEYHILQIVDSDTYADTSGETVAAYLSNFVSNDDTDDDFSCFKNDVLRPAMNENHIKVDVVKANASDLNTRIANADFIYFSSCGSGYVGDMDIANVIGNGVYDALKKYVFSDFKPIMIDSEILGALSSYTSSSETTVNATATKLSDYLRRYYNLEGSASDIGVISFKKDSASWAQHFNMSNSNTSTYITFDNKGDKVWNVYDYANYKHKILEITPDAATVSDIEDAVNDGSFLEAFADTSNMDADDLEYSKMTMAEFNANVSSMDLGEYDFIYISHASNEELYKMGGNDLSDAAKAALEKYIDTTNYDLYLKNHPDEVSTYEEAKQKLTELGHGDQVYVKRLIVDRKILSIYGENKTITVDTNTNVYDLLRDMVKLNDDGTATPIMKNVEVTSRGFFKNPVASTNATATTSLINRSTYRKWAANTNSKNFYVLEIEPYANVKNADFNNDSDRKNLTETLYNTKMQEEYEVADDPHYSYNMTEARIAAVTGLSIDQIGVVRMTANALCSTNQDILSQYDMVYIGGNNATVNEKEDWDMYKILSSKNSNAYWTTPFMSFNKKDLDRFYFGNTSSATKMDNAFVYTSYAHTGELGVNGDQRSVFSNNFNGKDFNRSNGSDLTAKMYLKLYDYIGAGMPVVIDKDVMSADYLIGGASVNADLVKDTDYVIRDSGKTGSSTLYRYKLDATHDDNDSYKGTAFKSTSYSEDTMTARRESNIDPESYMYQLLYHIAELPGDDLYHAPNVFVGFDADDLKSVGNSYKKGNTQDGESVLDGDVKIVSSLEKGAAINFFNETMVKTGTKVNYAKSGSAVQLKHFLNCYAQSRPVINLMEAPVDYDSTRDGYESPKGSGKYPNRIENSRKPTFKLAVEGLVPGHTYSVRVYYDLNGDSKFSDGEVDSRIEGVEKYATECVARVDGYTATSGVITFKEGATGVLDNFTVDKDFIGVLPYRILVEDSSNGKQTIISGTPKYYPEKGASKQELRLLQIIPGNGRGKVFVGSPMTVLDVNQVRDGKANYIGCSDGSDWLYYDDPADPKDDAKFGLYSTEKRLDNGNAENLGDCLDEYDIKLTTMTTIQFGQMCNAYLADYCKNFEAGDKYDERDSLTDDEKDLFRKFKNHFYDSANKTMKDSWVNMTIGDTGDGSHTGLNSIKTLYDFSNFNNKGQSEDWGGIPAKVTNSWLRKGEVKDYDPDNPNDGYLKIHSTHWRKDPNDTSDDTDVAQRYSTGLYDMIIIGFGRAYGGGSGEGFINDIPNIGCWFIKNYIEDNGAAFLGTDTFSFIGYDNGGTTSWSRNINQYLRECCGFDRFKYEKQNDGRMYDSVTAGSQSAAFYSAAGRNPKTQREYLYVPYTTATYTGLDTDMPGEFMTTNSYDGTYEIVDGTTDLSNGNNMAAAGGTDILHYSLGNGGKNGSDDQAQSSQFKGVSCPHSGQTTNFGMTTRIAMNDNTQFGLIKEYPYNIDTKASIATTNGQTYAADTESKDMEIWYSLAGAGNDTSALYAADPLNGRSFYYMFTYKSVTFTAAGYDALADSNDNEQERRLFINAILSKARSRSSGPSLVYKEFENDNNKDNVTDTENYVYKHATFTGETSNSTAVLSLDTQDPKACSFNFTLDDEQVAHFKDVYMFICNSNPAAKNDADDPNVVLGPPTSGDPIINQWHAVAANEDLPAASGNPLYNKGSHVNPQLLSATSSGNKLTITIRGDQDDSGVIDSYIKQGSFYITVYAKDSKGRKVSKRILIKTTTTMFDLT